MDKTFVITLYYLFFRYGNRVILLAGRKDGCIANIDMFNGEFLNCVDAHGSKGVIGMITNVSNDQVISAGRGLGLNHNVLCFYLNQGCGSSRIFFASASSFFLQSASASTKI